MGSGHAILRAIKKYGVDQFHKEILHVFDTEEQALLKEEEIVDQEIVNDRLSYNLTLGGKGSFSHCNNKIIREKAANTMRGRSLTDSHKEKISKALTGKIHHSDAYREQLSIKMRGKNNPRYGSVLSQEHKDKMTLARLEKGVSEETRKKISKIHKGKITSNETKRKISEAKTGVKDSDETRRKKSLSRIGKTLSEQSRLKLSKSLKGRKFNDAHKKKISEAAKLRTGSKNPNYKPLPNECIEYIKNNIDLSVNKIRNGLTKIGYKYGYGKVSREIKKIRNAI